MAAITGSTTPKIQVIGTNEEASVYGATHKIVVNYTDMNTLAATNGTLTLFTPSTGDWIGNFTVITNTAFAGTSVTAMTVQAGYTGTAAAFMTTEGNIFALGGARGSVAANNGYIVPASPAAIILTFTETGATDLTSLTAGKCTIYFKYLSYNQEGYKL